MNLHITRRAALAVSVAAFAFAGSACGLEPSRTSPGGPSTASASASTHDKHSGKVGAWAHADDGVQWSVTALRLSHVTQYASGGHPGDPAVSVAVRVKNAGTHRIDLSLMTADVRLGSDGYQAEEVFQEGYDNPTGTLGPNRTATFKFLFAAENRSDLKHVSVEVAPGMEYQSATFEGSV